MILDYEAAEAEYLRWSVVDDDDDIAECRRQARLVVDAAVPKPCEDGNYAPHTLVVGFTDKGPIVIECDGKPEADK